MPSKVWDKIIYAFPNFKGSSIEILNYFFIPLFIVDVITYPYLD